MKNLPLSDKMNPLTATLLVVCAAAVRAETREISRHFSATPPTPPIFRQPPHSTTHGEGARQGKGFCFIEGRGGRELWGNLKRGLG